MAILKFKNEKKEWEEFKVVSDGVTFIPSIDDKGNLSWDNNGHLPNPSTINLTGETVVMKDKKSDFPIPGKEYAIYIDKTTSIIYRWDTTQNTYIPLSTSSSSQAIVFVAEVPNAEDAEIGVIYAVDKGDKVFELWSKKNGEMVLVDGKDEPTGQEELFFAETADEFPAIGDTKHIYIATKDNLNLIYRWDTKLNNYITIGDKVNTITKGNESDAEAKFISENEIENLF